MPKYMLNGGMPENTSNIELSMFYTLSIIMMGTIDIKSNIN